MKRKKYEVEEEVQRFIDRLIFICYAEDKGFIDSELKPLLETKKDKYFESPQWLLTKIKELFNKYWSEYNSDLFRHGLCDDFFVEDLVLIRILTDLRSPRDRLPYDFASIEADILGKTYENFIGHVLTGEKRLKEKESKGKRKGMGIYYTPTYIVDYIVRNTVGEYIKGKSLASINKVKILDPACGSGSFLIKAFDVLVDESKNILKRELTYEEKKSLMLNCIHGVDLDERAVDICKLNLSLKLAERGQKLPELHNNIKCGNSLIDDKEVAGYKAFKWEDGFKEIISNGGFDVVVGNPPYVNNRNLLEKEKDFFETKYATAYQQYDIYVLFYEISLKLLKIGGFLGFITPNKFAITNYGLPLRKMLLEYKLEKIVDVSQLQVFGDASTYPYIVIVKKIKLPSNIIKIYNPSSSNLEGSNLFEIKQSDLVIGEPFHFNLSKYESLLLKKVIGEKLIEIYRAKPTSKNITDQGESFVITNKNIERYKLMSPIHKIKRNKQWLIEVPAILMKKICFIPTATIVDSNKYIPINTVYVIHPKINSTSIKYLLVLLNSKLIGYYTRKKYGTTAMRGGFIELRTFEIKNIPIKILPEYEDKLRLLADKMLSLNKKLHEENISPLEKQKLEQEIQKTDNEIDELVYQLYGITGEEKKIIEESLG